MDTSVAYCVQLCDGRFFPVQRPAGAAPEQTCSSFCPATRTKIYRGASIDQAVAADGRRYADLTRPWPIGKSWSTAAPAMAGPRSGWSIHRSRTIRPCGPEMSLHQQRPDGLQRRRETAKLHANCGPLYMHMLDADSNMTG